MEIAFTLNEDKAVAALAFVASERPGLSGFFISKVLFYAEKWHLNRYGRPIMGDRYIKMKDGPVPSMVKNYVDEKWDKVPKPEHFEEAVKVKRGFWVRWVYTGSKGANLELLSETDRQCLREAIFFCKDKSKEELSDLTHEEKAWLRAKPNRPMAYDDFVDDDNPHRNEILSLMQEQANAGMM